MKEKTNTSSRKVIIPFSFTYYPLKKLALINFEKHPDEQYRGLEPQYIDDQKIGKGYRVIAYRNDGYVDVYDEVSLNDNNDDSFNVAGKGLGERIKTEMEHTKFEKTDGCLHISFQFTDKLKRSIAVDISERTKKKTKGLHLLAPVGTSTENPSYLPLFFLYNFDFVRKSKTEVKVTINGKRMKIDKFPFPLPKDFQWRYYTRYSDDCQIIEFAKAGSRAVAECFMDDSDSVVHEEIEYRFTKKTELKQMVLQQGDHLFSVEFNKGVPDLRHVEDHSTYEDLFTISVDDDMGIVRGRYSVTRKNNEVMIELLPSGGWKPVPDSYFTKIMFREKSVFCSWPKTYRYTQYIDLITLQSVSAWERI